MTNNTLQNLQKEAKDKFFAGWGEMAVQMEANGFYDLFLKELVAHVFTAAIEEASNRIPGGMCEDVQTKYPREYPKGWNACREETKKNLKALLDK